jgi:RNA polymerase sigma-70 factor (ECF subfamily)
VSPPEHDAPLVRRAAAGDQGAFAALVTPRVPALSRLCRRLAGPALADDCVQDALVLALLRLGSLRDPDAFGWWLRGIAVRVCRRARSRLLPHAPLPDDDASLWLPGPESVPSLEERLGAADLARSVRAAVADLPAGQRHAVELFYLQGLPYEQAAAVLGIPVGALKTRLHKARAALAHRYRLADGPREPTLDDRTLSVHEAGHAALGWQDGDQVCRVAIAPRAGPHLGFVQAAGPTGGMAPRNRLEMLMAGEAAVARARPHRPRRDSGDRAAAARIARAATGGDDVEAALFIADALDAAHARLADPGTWSLVERIAEALTARRSLDADEFRALVTG